MKNKIKKSIVALMIVLLGINLPYAAKAEKSDDVTQNVQDIIYYSGDALVNSASYQYNNGSDLSDGLTTVELVLDGAIVGLSVVGLLFSLFPGE